MFDNRIPILRGHRSLQLDNNQLPSGNLISPYNSVNHSITNEIMTVQNFDSYRGYNANLPSSANSINPMEDFLNYAWLNFDSPKLPFIFNPMDQVAGARLGILKTYGVLGNSCTHCNSLEASRQLWNNRYNYNLVQNFGSFQRPSITTQEKVPEILIDACGKVGTFDNDHCNSSKNSSNLSNNIDQSFGSRGEVFAPILMDGSDVPSITYNDDGIFAYVPINSYYNSPNHFNNVNNDTVENYDCQQRPLSPIMLEVRDELFEILSEEGAFGDTNRTNSVENSTNQSNNVNDGDVSDVGSLHSLHNPTKNDINEPSTRTILCKKQNSSIKTNLRIQIKPYDVPRSSVRNNNTHLDSVENLTNTLRVPLLKVVPQEVAFSELRRLLSM